ncbi:MAG: alpha/beta fold hydrolase [Nevskia sp.]|nr:alpha/beta fold hydrolase [Nevskia sp.]
MTPEEFHAGRRFAATPFGRIAYVERGSGPVALFVHGLPLCGYQWRGQLDDLAPQRRCIALDLMGLGYSQVGAQQQVTLGTQAQMVAAFLDALNIERADLVGNDTGGGVCQIFAARHPARARSLSLTNCEVHDLWPNALLTAFYQGVAAGAFGELMQQMLGDVGLARQQLAIAYEQAGALSPQDLQVHLQPLAASAERLELFRKFSNWADSRAELVDAAPRLQASGIPAQVIWGEADVIFDTAPSLAWLRGNLGGLRKLTTVPRAMLFFPEEHPRLVSTVLRAFWEECSA